VALRIELLDVAPLVWRRVLVSNQWTLASLHRYLQWVIGWTDSHAHEFQVGASVVAPDWWIHEISLDAGEPVHRKTSAGPTATRCSWRSLAIANTSSTQTWCRGSAACSIRRASI
jgi:hypothetical protein